MKWWLLPLILILGFFLALVIPRFFYYQGKYSPPPAVTPSVAEVFIPTPTAQPFNDTFKQAQGTLVIDLAHDNWFSREELAILTQRLLNRGYRVEFLEIGSREWGIPGIHSLKLEKALRQAQALAVVLPWDGYSVAEARLVQDFLAKGGRVLLVADPTRPNRINSLAVTLGITFENDYLYNQIENDGNFRHIFITGLKESDLTQGLHRIALYVASSLSPGSWGVAFTDANTFSVGISSPGPYTPILLRPDGLVLALADFTFLAEPYGSVADNNRFISNIADWLTASQRRFSLSDFPYFLGTELRLEVAKAELVNQGLELKKILAAADRQAVVAEFKGRGNFAFLGLFEDGGKVESYLKAGQVSITVEEAEEAKKKVTLLVAGLGDVYRPGSALIYLYQKEDQSVLIILGDDEEALSTAIIGLDTGEFRDWLINDNTALHLPPKQTD